VQAWGEGSKVVLWSVVSSQFTQGLGAPGTGTVIIIRASKASFESGLSTHRTSASKASALGKI